MASFNRLMNGLCAFALVLAFGMTSVTPASAATDLERYDALNLAPMPDELADGLRGEQVYYWLYQGMVFTFTAMNSCARTGICWGAITRTMAQKYLTRYPKGNYTPGVSGSW